MLEAQLEVWGKNQQRDESCLDWGDIHEVAGFGVYFKKGKCNRTCWSMSRGRKEDSVHSQNLPELLGSWRGLREKQVNLGTGNIGDYRDRASF